jgi:fatty acid desaturase
MLSQLRYQADRRTLGFVATYLTLVAVGWLIWDDLATWQKVAWVGATSVFSFFCAVITHNTIHAPVFKKKGWNRAFQYLLSICYGHPVSAFVPGHNLSHHLHTQSPRDVMRTTKARFKLNILNQLLFMVVLGKDITNADLQYAMAMRKERPAWFAQWCREWAFFLAVMGTLLVLDPWKFLFLAMIPHLYAAWGIIGINFVQHDGTDQDHEYNNSRNFVGPLINWFAFNNGFHGIHHKKPGLHWSLTAKAHADEIAPHIHPNLDQPSLIKYCWAAYVYPGKRIMYDGSEYVMPPKYLDQEWIPGVGDTPAGVSLGAES